MDTIPARMRRNRNDLIDLSNDLEDTSSNSILHLFDPLSRTAHSENKNLIRITDNERSRPVNRLSQPVELRRKDRKLRATSACSVSSQARYDINHATKLIKEAEKLRQHSNFNKPAILSSGTILKSLHNSDSSAITSSSGDNELSKDSNELSFKINPTVNNGNEIENSKNDVCLKNFESESQAFGLQNYHNQSNSNRLRLLRKHQRSSQELSTLANKIKTFRSQFKHNDVKTNSGLVYSPTLYSSGVREMSVKLVITSPMAAQPLNFTCSVSTTIEHIISHAVCSMFDDIPEDDNMQNYLLKVTGKDEYLDSKLCLADYAIVSHCCKFDLDVQLTLMHAKSAKRSLIRTSKDDFRCKGLLLADDLLSMTSMLKYSDLNYEKLNIIIETFEREAQKLYQDVANRSTSIQIQGLLQTTKAICTLMMNCETKQLSESKDNLAELCRSYRSEGGSLTNEDRYKMIEVIQHAIKRLVENMRQLLTLFSKSLPVDYEVENPPELNEKSRKSFVCTPISAIKEQVSFKVQTLAQLKPEWSTRYQEFHLETVLMHGNEVISNNLSSSTVRIDYSFFPRLLFEEEFIFSTSYSNLPREARVILNLYGIEVTPLTNSASNQLTVTNPNNSEEFGLLRRSLSATSIASTAPMYSSSPRDSKVVRLNDCLDRKLLAVSMTYFFDEDLNLRQGERLLYMHLLEDTFEGSLLLETLADRSDPILLLDFKKFSLEKKIYFPFKTNENIRADFEQQTEDFEQLDSGVKFVLNTIINDKQPYEVLMDDEKALIWENRQYLTSIPSALPKFLLSVPNWSSSNLEPIYGLLYKWTSLDPVDAIQLLLPSFPDAIVRNLAVKWISKLNDDELCDFLPQLLQAFRYEKNIDCSLLWLLLERSLKNIRIANFFYWQMKLNTNDKLFKERSETLINCLLFICGSAFWKSTDKQAELLNMLASISNEIKKVRDSQRMSLLHTKLERVQDYLFENKPTMPWAPSLEVCDLEIRSCSYFPSNTVPLKLAFRSCEEGCNKVVKFFTYDTIFKMGDDLRQDMLAIQMIRIMEKLWLREGLDLRIVTFDCIATGERQGMVEMVQNAETLRKIQQSGNILSGPFNPRAIDNYIRLWNTSELEYKTALDKFLHSCAGYSVATYILGICDRHNDNIMITNSGHLFHIDFGKFLGDAQMMGSIKRDRTPFVLSSDMAYVINGGDKPSKKFQTFIELCVLGFNIIRRHRNLFLNLFSLMSSAKIHGLNSESVKYIDKMLMPNLTEFEAMAKFTQLINECLNSRSTQVNFLIHSLAQLRFSSDSSKQQLLSFVPKTFTMQMDGKIESLKLVHLFKRYETEKQYYFVVRVKRVDQPDFNDITRTFREFSELQMRLISTFPSYHFHDITKSDSSFLMDFVGRNNTRNVAEQRFVELTKFLEKLLQLPPEISQCDLIYTFFHPILRDQTTSNSLDTSLISESSSTFGSQEYSEAQRNALYLGSNGQVKISLSYKNESLKIMIMHAKNLSSPENSVGPNCYAKTYLLPDPLKQTKRKTRVVRQSCHPSFMELITYKITMENLRRRTLQVSIWHSELVQYKAFMGAALIPFEKHDFSKDVVNWYPLKNC